MKCYFGCEIKMHDILIEKILVGQNDSQLLDDLLEAFRGGYPVIKLKPVLVSEVTSIAKRGASILAELGKAGRPLVDTSLILLEHPEEQVRADAIENLLANSDAYAGKVAWSIIIKYETENTYIRQRIINYISRCPIGLLKQASESFPLHHELLRLISANPVREVELINSSLVSDIALVRAYAMGGLKRSFLSTQRMLRVAARSRDPSIKAVAGFLLGAHFVKKRNV